MPCKQLTTENRQLAAAPAYTKLILFGGMVEVKNPGESETLTKYYTIGGMRLASARGYERW